MPEGIIKSSPKQKILWGFIVGTAITIAFCLLYTLGWLEGFELWSYDLRFRLRGELPVRDDIVLVTKDEESKNILGKRGSDFTRYYFGAMIKNLAAAGADVIGIDFEFSKPVFQDPSQDACMIEALEYAGNVILARFISRGVAVKPYQPFRELELGEGLINFTNVDSDHVFRKVQMVEVEVDRQEAFFTLGMEMVKHRFYEYGLPEGEEVGAGQELDGIKREKMPDLELFTEGEKGFPEGYFRFGRFTLPENMLINYVGPAKSFPAIPFWRIKEGNFEPEEVGGKMVLVGTTLVADHDYYLTPFPSQAEVEEKGEVEIETREAGFTAGVEIHANIIQTILNGNFITRWKEAEIIGLTLLIGLLTAVFLIIFEFSIIWRLLVFTVLFGTVAGGSYYLFLQHNFWMDMIPLSGVIVFNFVGGIAYHWVMEQREKAQITRTFGQYVSTQVVRQLIADPSLARLGGEKKKLTVLFADIRGFTTFSERMEPESLVHFLNEYLTAMTEIVFEHEGVVDKYMGDAIMAFYGAPIEYNDHALKGCLTAIHMMETLKILQEKWREEGKPVIDVGIGLNTGPMTVGNMGSTMRFDYTVIGDAVNLASRLEGLNKQYGTNILISELTYKEVEGNVLCRVIDRVRVKGKRETVRIYELMSGNRSPDGLKSFGESFEKGFQLYQEQKWEEAIQFFQSCLKINSEDMPSQIYIKRCQEMKDNPPGKEWDGVYIMATK